ncbi:DUF2690 domain-containing protein [Arthrobacter sp.]|uniref:DUF2690 domain-containing protein n=1 Tax=Arthrobacter sp. TaxID=1667 RepID=UPI0026DEA511|nr:DUF2690 domain-containing protein [Arthrobacter sp.]MDO5752299.1 DUF2690 domain-containing protein [Arthrobacter sp.]
MWNRAIAMAGAALLAAGGFGLALPAAANAAPPTDPSDLNQQPFQSTDPIETGCDIGAYVMKSWDMHNAVYNEVQGLAQLVYSPTCETNWVNVYGFTPGNTYDVFISRSSDNIGGLAASVNAGGAADTLQTYAPGNTCVEVKWEIQNTTTAITEGLGSSMMC